jgi:MFS family permease
MTSKDVAAGAARVTVDVSKWAGHVVRGEVVKRVGGPARARVVTLFGAVLGLNGAATASVGAVAPHLESALHIGNGKIGLLVSVSLLVGAAFTIPAGLLVDRFKRIPLLSISIVLWSIASMTSAFASSYSNLLLSRVFLGAVVASAGPAIASLTGDYFPARERGHIYAYILGGEIAGTAVGFIICGPLASISWRLPFFILALPGFYLARELYRTVPEPLRGGQSRLDPGVIDLMAAAAAAKTRAQAEAEAPAEEPAAAPGEAPADPSPEDSGQLTFAVGAEPDGDASPPPPKSGSDGDLAQEAARKLGVKPDPKLVLNEDPRTMDLVSAVRYILSVPTNFLMIISSSLGYFYFSGLSTFALLFVRGHYHASQLTSELVLGALVGGALIGTLISGRVTDALLARGNLEVRVWVPAVCYLAAAALLIPAFLLTQLSTAALLLDVAGAAFLSAANPPLDAARLDIMPAGLWGRAEATRTVIRSLAQALAPLLFGLLSQLIAGILPAQTPIGTHVHGKVSSNEADGLEITFLLLLGALVAAGIFLLKARSTYPGDVATAAASNQGSDGGGGSAVAAAPRGGDA